MKAVLIIALLFHGFFTFGQEKKDQKNAKILIGIVVDQMRQDYLARFWNEFGENGFKRLTMGGANCTQVFYDYKPTYTGPGHASIFTGVGPSKHGIVGNNWYQREDSSVVYCAATKKQDGSYSYGPERLQCDGLADQIKKQAGAKAFSVSLKDRGAILPGGKNADAAYWFSSSSGKWTTSSYYKNANASWLNEWNKQDLVKTYLAEPWLYSGKESSAPKIPDSNPYEAFLSPNTSNAFPYNLKDAFEDLSFEILKRIPHGNQMTADFAKALSREESLGKDDVLDFLSISFSATDYVGHRFGVESRELIDTYIQLDKTLADLLAFFDAEYGADNYVLFLSSDHGAAPNSQYQLDQGKPGGYFRSDTLSAEMEAILDQQFGEAQWIEKLINLNLYFNAQTLKDKHKSIAEIHEVLKSYVADHDALQRILNPAEIAESDRQIEQTVYNGYFPGRSGDLILFESKYWMDYSETGTTHGTAYTYDTHVPLLIYGKGVEPIELANSYSVSSIAATLSKLCGISAPSCASEEVIHEILK